MVDAMEVVDPVRPGMECIVVNSMEAVDPMGPCMSLLRALAGTRREPHIGRNEGRSIGEGQGGIRGGSNASLLQGAANRKLLRVTMACHREGRESFAKGQPGVAGLVLTGDILDQRRGHHGAVHDCKRERTIEDSSFDRGLDETAVAGLAIALSQEAMEFGEGGVVSHPTPSMHLGGKLIPIAIRE